MRKSTAGGVAAGLIAALLAVTAAVADTPATATRTEPATKQIGEANTMAGPSVLFGRITVQWTETPEPGETFNDNELNINLGKWTLIQLPPPNNSLVVGQVTEIQVIDPGLPTARAVFTAHVSALGATGPKAGVIVVPTP